MLKHTLIFIRLFLLPQWRLFLAVLLTGVTAAAASGLGVPMMVKYIFPVVFRSAGDTPELLALVPSLGELSPDTLLVLACASMPALFLIRGVATWLNAYMMNLLGLRILENVSMKVFNRVQELPLSFTERRSKGDIVSRIVTDTARVQETLAHVANDLVKQPITCLCACIAFIWLLFQSGQGWLLLTNILFIAAAAAPIAIFGRRISKKALLAQENIGELNTVVQQNLSTLCEVRAYGLEGRQIREFEGVSGTYCRNMVKLVKYQQAIIPIIEIATAFALALLLVRGREAGMALTDFMAMAGALFFLFDSMKRAGKAFNRLNEAQGPLERLNEILQEPNDIPDPAEPKPLPCPLRGEIIFDHVSFEYEPGKPVLTDIDVRIPAGQIVGLVGPSGAGKTTFANLIPRFCEVSAGAVLLDGTDVREVAQQELRRHLSLVGQQALLFNTSIRENIALGKPGATEADITSAARAAAVESFLENTAHGLDTHVGEGGSNLSGGQRQRVAIARAFVKDAPVLILDEATASLDAESESEIQQSLDELAKGRTTLIVAHRFSTIRHADRILVFERGRIIGDGSHDELYTSCPLYKELYDKQGIQ